MTTTTTFRWTFAVTSSAWFAFALDRLVVATALPSIQVDLNATPADLVWVVNAYTLTFAVLLLTGAALGDRFGRRRIFSLGVAVFALGSAAAALAPGVGALVAARAVQGVGGAMFVPLSLTMLTAATEPARRGAVLGAWGGVGALGAAIGPLVGGGLVGAIGWRSIFWLNVPLGLVLAPLAARRLRESSGPPRRLDLVGVLLGSAGLFGLVWALVRGREAGWTSGAELLAFAGSGIALAAFTTWELRTTHPLLPIQIFRSRQFSLASMATCAMYAAMFGMLFLLTQLFQTGLGGSPLQAGSQLLPMAVMPMLLAPVGGLLADRLGPRPLIIAGLVMVAAAFGLLALVVSPSVPYGLMAPGLVLAGAGNAIFFAPITAASLSAVPEQAHGPASGTVTTLRELAGVLGVAGLGVVFLSHGGDSSPEAFAAGFRAAAGVAAAVAAAGAGLALALPTTDRPGRFPSAILQRLLARPWSLSQEVRDGIPAAASCPDRGVRP